MARDGAHYGDLRNETAVNVAGLLKEPTGETRSYRLILDDFEADGETIARNLTGEVRLTRLRDAVMAHVQARGESPMTCVRCLREYDQPFAIDFDEEYRQTVDVRTGLDLESNLPADELLSRIDENHELDLREVLRQEILVSLPMRPDCGVACPGPDVTEAGASDDETDDRLAALASLLGDEQDDRAGEKPPA